MGFTLWSFVTWLWKITIKIVDFPMNSMVDLSIAMLNYQRVQGNWISKPQKIWDLLQSLKHRWKNRMSCRHHVGSACTQIVGTGRAFRSTWNGDSSRSQGFRVVKLLEILTKTFSRLFRRNSNINQDISFSHLLRFFSHLGYFRKIS